MIEQIADLEGALLRAKGHELERSELRDWYGRLSLGAGTNISLAVARRRDSCEAFVIFVRDRDRFVGKAIGLPDQRDRNLYFSLAYYSPISAAIQQGIRVIELGPASARAKRRRGATGNALFGAFRLPGTRLTDIWKEISCVLEAEYQRNWGTRPFRADW
jgi:predicted N-acyltransferase